MRDASWRMWCAAAVCGAGLWYGCEAAAQTGGSVPSLAPSPALQSMQAASLYSAAASAPASGVGTPGTVTPLAPGGILNNPMATPLVYNSLLNASLPQGQTTANSSAMANLGATQLGMMLMLANQQNGGLGSGRISGTRGTSRQGSSLGTPPAANTKSRASDRPGGLASRYFNRSPNRPSYPQGYFNRRPSYFP